MDYKMKVVITNPKENTDFTFNLGCRFFKTLGDYGNQTYLYIGGEGFCGEYYDLRYDATCREENKEDFLKKWANRYWSGKNGAWSVKELEVYKA